MFSQNTYLLTSSVGGKTSKLMLFILGEISFDEQENNKTLLLF